MYYFHVSTKDEIIINVQTQDNTFAPTMAIVDALVSLINNKADRS
jgi:hypothetical protein